MELTPGQLKKFDAILWLTDPVRHKRTGRTYLLAVAYITHSKKYDMWVDISNHGHMNVESSKELINTIQAIVSQLPGKNKLLLKGIRPMTSIRVIEGE